jgi:hypothetical protein
MPLPFAFLLPEEDAGFYAVAWAVLLFPAGVYGVYGIVQAFRRKRAAAVSAGLLSVLPAVWFYISLCGEVFIGERRRLASNLALMFFSGFFPLAAGCWAVLLAYLIPDKPPADGPS